MSIIKEYGKNHVNDPMFFHLKILSNTVYIMWQRLKTFHRGKLEMLRKMTKNDKILNCLPDTIVTAFIQKIKLDK